MSHSNHLPNNTRHSITTLWNRLRYLARILVVLFAFGFLTTGWSEESFPNDSDLIANGDTEQDSSEASSQKNSVVSSSDHNEMPLIKPQPDGVIYLNAEAAGFLMQDDTGLHTMNHIDPQLEIVDGRILKLGKDAQFPAWRFAISQKNLVDYEVIVNLNCENSEPCEFRISFFQNGGEGRVVGSLVRSSSGSGVKPVALGKRRFTGGGEIRAVVMIQSSLNMERLPEIQDVRLIPIEAAQTAMQTQKYPKTMFPISTHKIIPPLFPTGNLNKLPIPPTSNTSKNIVLDLPPPRNAAERQNTFAQRNTPDGLKDLCTRLSSALVPGLEGLESFEKAHKAQDYALALEAYRNYFFKKLKQPELYGAGNVKSKLDFFQKSGKLRYIRQFNPVILQENLAGIESIVFGSTRYQAPLGVPGRVNWAPSQINLPKDALYERVANNIPFWRTPEGQSIQAKIELFRRLNRLNNDNGTGAFSELLFSYLMTGHKEHLKLYAEYMEDWAMNSTTDVDNCPVNIRAAVELQIIGGYLTMLRVILDERPELALDFPAPALARFNLFISETFLPYIVRAKRAEIANWGIMGVAGGLSDSLLMNEFQSMRYMNREFSRLARINWIQHLALDGENLEAWDEGHMAIDIMLGAARFQSLFGSPVMGPFEKITFEDHLKVGQRTLLTHFSPDGNYWVPWIPNENSQKKSIRGKILSRNLINNIFDEPEARRRINSALNLSQSDLQLPLSDIQPYGMLAYLRDGFGGHSSSLLLQNFPERSQTQGWSYNTKRGHLIGCLRTQYNVAFNGVSLLEASPILIDSKPPNIFVDKIPTGGKTDKCFQTPRNILAGRFISNPEFDVVETIQDAPYRRFLEPPHKNDLLGVFQNTPDEALRNVHAKRQIIHLRGEGIYLISDSIQNSGPEREYSKMFALPVRLASLKDRNTTTTANLIHHCLDIEPSAHRARSQSLGLPNISLYVFGHPFIWGGQSTGENTYAPLPKISEKDVSPQKSNSKAVNSALPKNLIKVLSVRWRGKGNQALASIAVTRPPVTNAGNLNSPLSNGSQRASLDRDLTKVVELNGAQGVVGYHFTSPLGTEGWHQIAPNASTNLVAGPGKITGKSILVLLKNEEYSGVVMGANKIMLNGIMYSSPTECFTFKLSTLKKFTFEPILSPIDTTIIHPQKTVFSDNVEVSFNIPTQNMDDLEFHYTLDGSDPSLTSPLYHGPFSLTQDTLVKVRPFRKGLATTPWNIAGVEAGKTVSAIFYKHVPKPAQKLDQTSLKRGLNYQYIEGSWPQLMSQGHMAPYFPVMAEGVTEKLLGPDLATLRKTDRAYSVKYDGYIDIPTTGVFRFFAPEHLYNTTMDAGYDLRLWIDGEEWFPNPDLHAENIWSVALAKGHHHIQVSYTDFRWKQFRNEYWMSWNPQQVWQGIPLLEMDGPNLAKQKIPDEWMYRARP